MTAVDPVDLTRRLVRLDSRNPPGDEVACAELLAGLLAPAGFATTIHRFGESRVNLVARRGNPDAPAVVMTGHMDTVPLGTAEWTQDPFGGDIVDGRLYGRGSTDMKAGIAAIVAAALAEAATSGEAGTLCLIFTGGEETGADGARALVAAELLPRARLMVVGEPTGNRVLAGHKGALWLRACCRGVTAHGSTPHLGDNAIFKAARAALAAEGFQFNVAAHPVMGRPTLNLGTVSGGQNINSVPDRAEFTLDIRTIPGLDHGRVVDEIGFALGPDTAISRVVDLPPVWSDPGLPAMRRAAMTCEAVTGMASEPASANYFTDAAVLTPAMDGVPTIVCGPGDPDLAHKIDESCAVARIVEAEQIYRALIRAFADAGPA
jgi:succinyl-diaminopimelate desuccinylase